MAGASIAAELSPHVSVLLAEAEDSPGYHATGRSAAFWEECYGGPEIVPLTLASGPSLHELGVLKTRGALYIGRGEDEDEVADFHERFSDSGATLRLLERDAIEARIPGVREGWRHAVFEPACADIDVAALHQHYLACARQHGVQLRTSARLRAAEREGDAWRLHFGSRGEVRARWLIDAAGAWADDLAVLAGVQPLGITPLRRTVVQLRTQPEPPDDLPLVLDIAGRFYFKPEHGKLWLSPHDETPSAACDAAPEEFDVAVAIERLGQVVDWQVEAVEHRWAGLRSFAPDRRPVYGVDPSCDGFFWFAGQGGFGIQTAPAAARLGAQLLLDLPRDDLTAPLEPALYSPERFR